MRSGGGALGVDADIGCWIDGWRWSARSAMRFTREAWRITAVEDGEIREMEFDLLPLNH